MAHMVSRFFSSQSPNLVYFVTARCNARCDFCLYKTQIEAEDYSKELRPNEVEEIARNFGEISYLAISGGEPFLRSDLYFLIDPFLRYCKTRVVDIPSNFAFGDSIVDTMSELLAKHPNVIFDLQLSIDGIGSLHNESRKVSNLYQKALGNFKRAQELRQSFANLRLKVNVVYLPRNKDNLGEIEKELTSQLDADRYILSYPNKVIDLNCESHDFNDYSEYCRWAERFSALGKRPQGLYGAGMRAARVMHNEILGDAISGRRAMGEVCEAGRRTLVLSENGDVYPCENLWHLIGNLRSENYRIRSILDGEAYAKFRENFLGPKKCNCTWGCAALNSATTGKRFVPRLGAQLAKEMLKNARS